MDHAGAVADDFCHFADKSRIFPTFNVIMQLKRRAHRVEIQRHGIQRRDANAGGQQRYLSRRLQRKQIARRRDKQRLARAQRLMNIA
jgi:hypothetical protein